MGDLARRMLVTTDAERRRLERVLHDGAQQRLVAVSATLALAHRRLEAGEDGALELVEQATEEAKRCLDDLRDLARQIYPAVLSECGLSASLNDLARRAPGLVEVTAAPERRLPEVVEIASYFVVSEALSHLDEDGEASVSAEVDAGSLVVDVHGASLSGSELEGLGDRVGALGGRLESSSSAGERPLVRATIPLDPPANGGGPA